MTEAARIVTENELRELGYGLGRELGPGAVVWLEGELGAGKTTVAKAILRGLGVEAVATSPTYSLVHRYEGSRGPVYHVDCYRLEVPEEARDLDWESLAEGDAVLIEWPEKANGWIAPPSLRLTLGYTGDPDRRWVEVHR